MARTSILILLTIASFAASKDFKYGIGFCSQQFKSFYDKEHLASPAIWRQVDRLTINNTDDRNVICEVKVTDLRPNKDGEVEIVGGGIGAQNITLELKSPSILRGYGFRVEVFPISKAQFNLEMSQEWESDLRRGLPLPEHVFFNVSELEAIVAAVHRKRIDLSSTTEEITNQGIDETKSTKD